MAAKAAVASKSDAVREYFHSHPDAPVKDVVASLAADGVKVSVALANKIKYSGGKPARGAKGKKAKRKVSGGKVSAKRSAMADMSKAQAIRDTFTKLGRNARPRDVISDLKDQGVVVSAAQVSMLRKGLRKAGRPVRTAAAAPASHNGGVSEHELLAAKKLADLLGIDAAKKALDLLAKLKLN